MVRVTVVGQVSSFVAVSTHDVDDGSHHHLHGSASLDVERLCLVVVRRCCRVASAGGDGCVLLPDLLLACQVTHHEDESVKGRLGLLNLNRCQPLHPVHGETVPDDELDFRVCASRSTGNDVSLQGTCLLHSGGHLSDVRGGMFQDTKLVAKEVCSVCVSRLVLVLEGLVGLDPVPCVNEVLDDVICRWLDRP